MRVAGGGGSDGALQKIQTALQSEIRRRIAAVLFFLWGGAQSGSHRNTEEIRVARRLFFFISGRRVASRRVCRAVNSTVRAIEFDTSR